MSSEISITLKAKDEASRVIADAGKNITTGMGKVEESGKRVGETQRQTNASAKDLVMGFSGLATSAFSLYNAYDRVTDMQVSVDRANLQVKTSAEGVENAQNKLNTAIEKYGADSAEAREASDDLALAQDRYQVSVERAEMVQGNMNEAMVSSALSVIPTVITAIGSLSTIKASWTAITGGVTAAQTALGGALNFLAANPIILVVTAIGLIVAALIAAYNACPPFRDAVNAIGKALGDFFGPVLDAITKALTWLWENVLVPLGNFIVNTFIGIWNGLTAAWNVLSGAVDAVYNGLKWLWDNIFVPVASFIMSSFVVALQFFTDVWNVLAGAVNAVYNGLKWLWDNVLVPLGNFIGGALLGAWNAFANGLSWAYNNLIKPVFDALNWVYVNVLKPVADFLGTIWNGISGIGNAIGGFFGGVGKALGLAEGGIVTGPTLALIGEAGPEAVVPLREFGSLPGDNGSTVYINAPLVWIQGSADKETVELAAQRVMQQLRSVVVEATSGSAPSTQKSIRMGSVFA